MSWCRVQKLEFPSAQGPEMSYPPAELNQEQKSMGDNYCPPRMTQTTSEMRYFRDTICTFSSVIHWGNLTHYTLPCVGSCQDRLPKTPDSKARRALTQAQRRSKAGNRAAQGQDGSGANFNHLQLPWFHTWEAFTARIQAAVTGQRKGFLFVPLMTQLSRTAIKCLTFPKITWSKCSTWHSSSIIYPAQVHDCN